MTMPFRNPLGGLPALPPAAPALTFLFFPPSPQPPSPPGKGEIFWFSYARGFAPCIPGTEPGRHWLNLRASTRRGSLPLPRLLCLPYHSFFSPIPRPLPLRGRGRFFGFLMQGASPLASPGLSRKRHWLTLPLWHPAGSLPGWSPDDYAFPESAGGLACFATRRPRLDLSLFPPSPRPLPLRGRGRFLVDFAGGFNDRTRTN